MCVQWGEERFPGLTSFLQILSEFQKYIQEEASLIRWIAAPSHSSGCLKQPRWSRCCISTQPRVERSQLMIQLNKTWKRAERYESREGSTFRCFQAQIIIGGDTRGEHQPRFWHNLVFFRLVFSLCCCDRCYSHNYGDILNVFLHSLYLININLCFSMCHVVTTNIKEQAGLCVPPGPP